MCHYLLPIFIELRHELSIQSWHSHKFPQNINWKYFFQHKEYPNIHIFISKNMIQHTANKHTQITSKNKVKVHMIFIELSLDKSLDFVSNILSKTFQEEPTSNHKEPTSQLRQISGGSVPTSEIHQINCQLQLNTITPFHQLPTKRHWFDPEFQTTFISNRCQSCVSNI